MVTISCFQGAEPTCRAEADSTAVDRAANTRSSQLAAGTTDTAQALCTIKLDTVQSCQLLCSMALELQSHCLKTTPHALLPWTTPATLINISDLVVHAGFSLQASALNALAAILPEIEFELIPVHGICTVLLTALDEWTSSESIPPNHPASQVWQRHMLTCLNLLAGIMDGSETEAGAAEGMLRVLPRIARCLPAGRKSLQAQLCSVVLHVARQYPSFSHHMTGLSPLLSEPGQVGRTVNLTLQLLLDQLGAAQLDAAFPASQVSCCFLHDMHAGLVPVTLSTCHIKQFDLAAVV